MCASVQTAKKGLIILFALAFSSEELCPMLENQKEEAQQVLDELFIEHALPFKLTAFMVEHLGGEEYIVRFHDSRISAIDLSWCSGQSFKDAFRTAIVERMQRASGFVGVKRAHDQT